MTLAVAPITKYWTSVLCLRKRSESDGLPGAGADAGMGFFVESPTVLMVPPANERRRLVAAELSQVADEPVAPEIRVMGSTAPTARETVFGMASR